MNNKQRVVLLFGLIILIYALLNTPKYIRYKGIELNVADVRNNKYFQNNSDPNHTDAKNSIIQEHYAVGSILIRFILIASGTFVLVLILGDKSKYQSTGSIGKEIRNISARELKSKIEKLPKIKPELRSVKVELEE